MPNETDTNILKDRIIALMQQPKYAALTKRELADELRLGKKERRRLDHELRRLLSEGDVIRIKGDRLCIPRDVDLVTGAIRFRAAGSAFVIPDATASGKDQPTIYINAEDTGVALHGDKVVVRIYDKEPVPALSRKYGKKPYKNAFGPFGRVIRIRERARDTVTGTLCKTRFFYYVAPDDPRIIHDIYVPDPAQSSVEPKPTEGSKVVVKLHEWEQRHVNPEGEIILNLGRTHEPQAELMAILHKYNLNPEFPKEAREEAEAIPPRVTKDQLRGRRDLRKIFTFTIDPDDAKDFDDALSVERPDKESIRVGIHIADVSTYVKPRSKLDVEAQNRGNSTYLVGKVIPMLPHALSNGICSLVEDQDRLTKSVFVTFGKGAQIKSVDFANTVIRSNKRLTYKQAYALLKHDDLAVARQLQLPPAHQTGSTGRPLNSLPEKELRKLQTAIRELWTIAERLRAQRMKKGSLNLDMEETKILVDEQGYADRLEKVVNDESHQLIEEYMLLANECVARELKRAKLPAIYRVHEDPDEEKLNELREYMATWGIETGDLSNRKELMKLLTALDQHPQARLLRTQVLRSLKKACYKASPEGHFGLYKNDYTHFTSPIRRYSDLVVHRVFETFLVKHLGAKPLSGRAAQYNAARASSIAEHLSHTEVNSVEAERESIKVKLLEFFERELEKPQPTAFRAIVTELRNHGMFIELTESGAFGMVHISTLRDDLYHLSGDGAALVGRRSGKRYTLGQEILVVADKVDRFKRQVDFRVVDSGAAPSRRGGGKRETGSSSRARRSGTKGARSPASAKRSSGSAAAKSGGRKGDSTRSANRRRRR